MTTVLCRLSWGLGDVLLSTSAIHEYRRLHPDHRIIYQTYLHNQTPRYKLEYPKGNPGEMLWDNPDIDELIDLTDTSRYRMPAKIIDFHYADFGGPSLDYPIQAHYWENMGLQWQAAQRFDAYYHLRESEVEAARKLLGGWVDEGLIAMSPLTGWPGKDWSDEGWFGLIDWALRCGLHPVILSMGRLAGPGWEKAGVVNLSGQLDIRETAPILPLCRYAVMLEGSISNLQFALGLPAILLTCATQRGLQIWVPPELTTEVRAWRMPDGDIYYGTMPLKEGNEAACEPCMWRRDHVKYRRADVPPASIKNCPAGRSLRDVPVEAVIAVLERQMP